MWSLLHAPSVDPLLYLICFQDGIYPHRTRVSTSCGLHFFFLERMKRKSPLFLNTNQATSSGKYLEMEMTSAAIIASHSYPHGLCGCPLGFLLCSLVAELKVTAPHVSYASFNLEGMPPQYEGVLFGLLSPANANWQEDKSYSEDQSNAIMLCNCTWSANKEQNDGLFPVGYNSRKLNGSMEAKCYQDKVRRQSFKRRFTRVSAGKTI